MKTHLDIFATAKGAYTIAEAWAACRLPDPPAPGAKVCRSPFREDRNPSFSISADGRLWHDFATGEGGDVVSFAMRAFEMDAAEARRWFAERLGIDLHDGRGSCAKLPPRPPRKPEPPPPQKAIKWPDGREPVAGDETVWRAFADGRGMTYEAVRAAAHAGIIRFLEAEGHQSFVITDDARKAAEIRRIDGGVFRNGRKCFNLSGVDKSWPVGAAWLRETPRETPLLICEGATDFFSAWNAYAIFRRDGGDKSWLPLALLGASCRKLHPKLERYFRKRLVRIVPDADEAGDAMAEHWRDLLLGLGCTVQIVKLPRGRDLRDMLESGETQPGELFQ